MNFRWFRSVPAAESETWEERLFSTGHTNLAISESPADGQLLLEGFFDSREEAERFEADFGGEVEAFAEQNWVAMGTAGTRRKSIRIRDRFLVSLDEDPAFLDELRAENPGLEFLIFPPDMAFGTGDHETTSTCLEMLVDHAPDPPWSFLDLGTGTGILAVAAAKLGAERILAMDFDPKAIEVAGAALERQGVSAELREQDALAWEPAERFDFVAANLFSDVLIAGMAKIREAAKPGGVVVLSGILRQQLREVEIAAEEAGLAFQAVVELGKWATARFRG